MNLETIFTDQADQNGLYRASVTIEHHKDLFRRALSDACFDLGIECGLNETKGGFDLGFRSRDDYTAALEATETKLLNGLDQQGRSSKDRRTEAAMKRNGISRPETAAGDDCKLEH